MTIVSEPIGDGGPYSRMRLPDGTTPPDGRSFLVGYLVQRHNWIDDPQCSSNSAQAFAAEIYERYPAITNDDHTSIPDLVNIMLDHCGDPRDFDTLGAALDLLRYIARSYG